MLPEEFKRELANGWNQDNLGAPELGINPLFLWRPNPGLYSRPITTVQNLE
jgi:hypothetical protein